MSKNKFEKRIKLTQEILARISKIDETKGLWKTGLRVSPQILGRLKAWVIITSTGASTRIEGAKMTDDEIARFLRGVETKQPTNRDEQEVAGYANLIGRIFDNYKTIKLSENWILQLHDILLSFSNKDQLHKGRYKSANNTVAMITDQGKQIVLFAPTPPYLVPLEMQEVISDMRQKGISPETIQRQERILSRLLEAQRSVNERDKDQSRESKSAENIKHDAPRELDLNSDDARRALRDEMLRSSGGGYSKDYQVLIRKYLEKLEK